MMEPDVIMKQVSFNFHSFLNWTVQSAQLEAFAWVLLSLRKTNAVHNMLFVTRLVIATRCIELLDSLRVT